MGILTDLAAALDSGAVEVIDLTAPLSAQTPILTLPESFGQTWRFALTEISKYDDRGPAWYWNNISTGEHTGTHFDAPVHWITGKDLPNNTCDTIPPRQFVGLACVIDVTSKVATNEDFLLMPEHIVAWEERNGKIPAGAWVLLRTGWSTRKDPAAFLNVRSDGPHSPGFHKSASMLLAHDRDVLGVGVETVGTDAGQAGTFDPPFPNHGIMHGAGKFGLASLRNLDRLPATGSIVIAAPLKLENGSGSPLRVLAIAPA